MPRRRRPDRTPSTRGGPPASSSGWPHRPSLAARPRRRRHPHRHTTAARARTCFPSSQGQVPGLQYAYTCRDRIVPLNPLAPYRYGETWDRMAFARVEQGACAGLGRSERVQ
ncbi:hypothetical protein DL764_000993 [Monosporascus ibericus]|uniref:Uncharacterized protein n=1 Tax=Monosporascus ibericus TaxID=155417 RepID=A0A4V1XCI4_9PEZI|nr:hypothetical protein DL764_000993 [Monosporascus ibericus]